MELLKKLYCIHSMSMQEKKMKRFVKRECERIGAVCHYDKRGNLYAVKGESDTYPCIVAHLDQVQRSHSKDFTVYEQNGILFAYSATRMEQQGLGADDKNGIWVALKCLEKYDALKCAFFIGEEIGCVGSEMAEMDFFDDCRFVIQCDRRGGYDFISDAVGTELCSKEFMNDTQMALFGYKETNGSVTDVMTLKENGLKVSCCNMSCGYYNPHTESECTNFWQLENCLHFVENIVENCTKVYPHEYVKSCYSYPSTFLWDNKRGFSDNELTSTKKKCFDKEYAIDDIFEMLQSNPSMTIEELWNEIKLYYPKITKDFVRECYDDFAYYYESCTEDSCFDELN